MAEPICNWLALAWPCTYHWSVKYLRAFTMICFGFGLFVQVAAQAAAIPQPQIWDMADCAEMAQSMPMQTEIGKEDADRTGPCREMTLGCLVAMNCVPPLALTDSGTVEPLPPIVDGIYRSASVEQLDSLAIVPESPPPQNILTV